MRNTLFFLFTFLTLIQANSTYGQTQPAPNVLFDRVEDFQVSEEVSGIAGYMWGHAWTFAGNPNEDNFDSPGNNGVVQDANLMAVSPGIAEVINQFGNGAAHPSWFVGQISPAPGVQDCALINHEFSMLHVNTSSCPHI